MEKYKSLPLNKIKLTDEKLLSRRRDNYRYLMKLTSDNLIRNHEYEAGIMQVADSAHDLHGGWENPYCQLRGHFLGHWLSAAAQNYAATGDAQIKAKADSLVDRLAVCQLENGGQWAGSIPVKYLDRIADKKAVWAPQYTLHKTFMGLLDMYKYANNSKALEIAQNWADWFYDWSSGFSREQFDDILDYETGGMLEIWAHLFAITGNRKHYELINRYYRGRLFDALLAGQDVLTNMHANTTIPEIMGAAAAYQATKEPKWLDICQAYWDLAVTARGSFCTGGQTLGEVWTPPGQQKARLGDKNQEHCTVYNMMRLADFLLKITGNVKYADYYEQNLYNGIFAQAYWHGHLSHGAKADHPDFGLLTYFLPLRAGGRKGWAHETRDFFCCHGSLVQANATFHEGLLYSDQESISICQYFSYTAECSLAGGDVALGVEIDTLSGQKMSSSVASTSIDNAQTAAAIAGNPHMLAFNIEIEKSIDADYALRIREPWWLQGQATLILNGQKITVEASDGFLELKRRWQPGDILHVRLPKGLHCWQIPDAPDTVAFMDGPVVLAGLVNEERVLCGDINNPDTILRGDNEREWGVWFDTYHTLNLDRGFRLVPLYKIGYEPYAVYFPVVPKG